MLFRAGYPGRQQISGNAVLNARLDLNLLGPALDPSITFTRASVGTYLDGNGILLTAGNNTPRFDHDRNTWDTLGLMIEEARTNVVWSSLINTAQWAISGALQALGSTTTAPDGTAQPCILAASTTANGIRNIGNGPSTGVLANTAYTVSAFIKPQGNNGYIQVNASAGGGPIAAGVAYFDLAGGAGLVGADLIAGLTVKSVGIAPASGGWFRCSFTFTTPATTTAISVIVGPCVTVSASGDNRSYVGVVGNGICLWGVQGEAGAFASSYIPTTVAAVTRAADLATFPSGTWRAAGAESYCADAMLTVVQNATVRLIGAAASTLGPVVIQNSTNGLTFDGAGLVQTANALTYATVTKIAATWTNPTGKVCMNGGPVASTASMTAGFGSIASFKLGGDAGAAEQLNGYIRRFRYWPRVLSDTEMQQVTA